MVRAAVRVQRTCTLSSGTQRWEYEYGVTCVEYTEFERLGVPDAAEDGSRVSRYPANTNILYLGLQVCLICTYASYCWLVVVWLVVDSMS